jgi:hypothetical protein
MIKKLASIFGSLVIVSAVSAAHAVEKKELSEKAVKIIMGMAWSMMPTKIKDKDGKPITIDLNNPDEGSVPITDGRRIIMAARRSAHAQICDQRELQEKNYRALMNREIDRKKWSRKQIVYINQLHLFTVMWMTGNVSLDEESSSGKKIAKKPQKKPVCTEKMRTEVVRDIKAYLAEGGKHPQ